MNREKESNFVSAVVYLHDNAEQVSPFRSAGFQDGVVDLFGLLFQPLAVFFVCQVKAFHAQVCTKNAERSRAGQKLLQLWNVIFLHDAAEHGRMQV